MPIPSGRITHPMSNRGPCSTPWPEPQLCRAAQSNALIFTTLCRTSHAWLFLSVFDAHCFCSAVKTLLTRPATSPPSAPGHDFFITPFTSLTTSPAIHVSKLIPVGRREMLDTFAAYELLHTRGDESCHRPTILGLILIRTRQDL